MKEVKDKEKNNFFENLGKLLKNKLGWDESVKEEVDEKDIFSGRRLLNKELKIAFDKNNITIPFPQLDVHTK